MSYSKLKSVHLTNFMSIKKGSIHFDDQGIITIVGYNNSGKSAFLRAMDVALNYSNPTKQKKFIHDGTRFFQVDLVFDDDVTIRYEKHESGSSLYEMFKGSESVWHNRINKNTFEKIDGVPTVIRDYLGMVTTPNGISLNYGVNTDPQLLVDTSGSENYAALSSVLKSEELSAAVKLLNSENNQLQSKVNYRTNELNVLERQQSELIGLDADLVLAATQFDTSVTANEELSSKLSESLESVSTVETAEVLPELDSIDYSGVSAITEALTMVDAMKSVDTAPELEIIDFTAYNDLLAASALADAINDDIVPDIPAIDDTGLVSALGTAYELVDTLSAYDEYFAEVDAALAKGNRLKSKLSAKLREDGYDINECPNCGELYLGAHTDI